MTPPPFEMVSDLMENGTITEYVKKYPQVDRIDLVRKFVSAFITSSETSIIAAVGRGRWPPLPPLMQNNTWKPEGRESF